MFSSLSQIIPGFELDINKANSILVEESNACTSEWVNYSLIESFLRDASSKVIFVASQQHFTHY